MLNLSCSLSELTLFSAVSIFMAVCMTIRGDISDISDIA